MIRFSPRCAVGLASLTLRQPPYTVNHEKQDKTRCNKVEQWRHRIVKMVRPGRDTLRLQFVEHGYEYYLDTEPQWNQRQDSKCDEEFPGQKETNSSVYADAQDTNGPDYRRNEADTVDVDRDLRRYVLDWVKDKKRPLAFTRQVPS